VPDESGAAAAGTAALYQELILDHYRRPRNRGAHEHPDGRADARNPLCGDEVEVTILGDGGRVREARAASRGCSIAAASASMMTELVAGRDAGEVAALRAALESLLGGDAAAASDVALGDLRALAGLARFPARHRCALLPWEALRRAMEALPGSREQGPGSGVGA